MNCPPDLVNASCVSGGYDAARDSRVEALRTGACVADSVQREVASLEANLIVLAESEFKSSVYFPAVLETADSNLLYVMKKEPEFKAVLTQCNVHTVVGCTL